jgi:DNA-binding transcriptional regulator YdaS (Cro superfamily)
MMPLTEEHIAELIALLPPPPAGWVQAATELPAARAAMDRLVEQAAAGDAARRAIISDLEGALLAAGVDPRPQLVRQLQARLGTSSQWR